MSDTIVDALTRRAGNVSARALEMNVQAGDDPPRFTICGRYGSARIRRWCVRIGPRPESSRD